MRWLIRDNRPDCFHEECLERMDLALEIQRLEQRYGG